MALGYRPMFRSALARTLYERIQKEEDLRNYDKALWYKCNLDLVVPEKLRKTFVHSHFDGESEAFLDHCYEKSDWIFTQLFHAVAKAFLCWFMTRTSVNGFLGRGSMFVFSKAQVQTLLGLSYPDMKMNYLLDIGAGDGAVTRNMASHFRHIHVTEVSPVMRRLLGKQGFQVLNIDSWYLNSYEYDVISCLNVLDRCDKPITLLNQMKSKLKPKTGIIILAVVLPLSQYVESVKNHLPIEEINVGSDTAEAQFSQLVKKVFTPLDLEVMKWTKLPYLSEGDIDQYFYWLDDYVVVLKQKDNMCDESNLSLQENNTCS